MIDCQYYRSKIKKSLTDRSITSMKMRPKVLIDCIDRYHWYRSIADCAHQGCGAGTGTGRNRIHLETLEPEPYSEYGSGSEYKKMKQTTPKNLTKSLMISVPYVTVEAAESR